LPGSSKEFTNTPKKKGFTRRKTCVNRECGKNYRRAR
jgi:hypothetical protein